MLLESGLHEGHEERYVSHPILRWPLLAVLPLLSALGGCGSTMIFLDKLDTAGVGQPPAPPETGTSTSSGAPLAVIAEDPQNAGSADRWLRLSRTNPVEGGGQYIGTFTQNVTQKKAGVNLVGFIPQSSRIMMTVYYESGLPQEGIALLHIDLLPTGQIRVNDTTIAGTFRFDHLVGIFVGFDLTGSSPSANILVRGGGQDASLEVPIPANAAIRGIGRVRIVAPFEGVNAPNGSFLVDDIIATTPE
jgi:hypothetical protein